MDAHPHPRRPAWHWLILLTPAVAMVTLCWLIDQTFHGESSIGPLMLNLLTIPLVSMGLGYWWMRAKEDVGARIAQGLLAGLGIAVVNGLIAFAGCSMGIMK
ncbi:MAG TPA: hypothetical protein VGO11_18265 [Chthoniobacteraceae bacterium]|jgi:hypothetical protein|nr:hypothetical protein [Chthoniobacteraceae bacterium]